MHFSLFFFLINPLNSEYSWIYWGRIWSQVDARSNVRKPLLYYLWKKSLFASLKLDTGHRNYFFNWEKCGQLNLCYHYLVGRKLMEELEGVLEDAKIHMINSNFFLSQGKESGSKLLLWANPEVTKLYLCSSGKTVPTTGTPRLLVDHWIAFVLCALRMFLKNHILLIDLNSAFN